MRDNFSNILTATRFNQARHLMFVPFLLIFSSFVAFESTASPITPDEETVVARWPVALTNTDQSASLEQVTWHIQQAQYPGKANLHYALAKKLLSQVSKEQQGKPLYLYLQARLLQYQHEFEQAQDYLTRILDQEPNNANALLLKANLHLALNQLEAGLSTCKRLVGRIDITIATACSAEVTSYQGQGLENSYRVLRDSLQKAQGIVAAEQDSDSNSSQRDTLDWLEQVVAEMALRLNKPTEAIDFLDSNNLHQKPLSYVVLWADIQRELGQQALILNTLGDIVNHTDFKDDALLIRLAMAEQSMPDSQQSTFWRELAQQRVALRIARGDDYHGADIARYYLYVDVSPKLALEWARKNYQHAKLFDDQRLLQAAKVLQQQGA